MIDFWYVDYAIVGVVLAVIACLACLIFAPTRGGHPPARVASTWKRRPK